VLLIVAATAVLAAIALASSQPAAGSTGGVTLGDKEGEGSKGHSAKEEAKYMRLWDRVDSRDRRWARKTAKCESGGNPRAIGGGGAYRGAFQFMKSTWRSAPKSPGGDPIDYPYRTQAVVAVALKNRDGANHWPNCG
jgi:hypothetical protein